MNSRMVKINLVFTLMILCSMVFSGCAAPAAAPTAAPQAPAAQATTAPRPAVSNPSGGKVRLNFLVVGRKRCSGCR